MFFITTKQALLKDVTKEWNMKWLAFYVFI